MIAVARRHEGVHSAGQHVPLVVDPRVVPVLAGIRIVVDVVADGRRSGAGGRVGTRREGRREGPDPCSMPFGLPAAKLVGALLRGRLSDWMVTRMTRWLAALEALRAATLVVLGMGWESPCTWTTAIRLSGSVDGRLHDGGTAGRFSPVGRLMTNAEALFVVL